MKGVKLSSYAAWWIRAYIIRFVMENWRLVKLGTTQAQRKLFFNLRKEKEKIERMGFEADHKLLAERLDDVLDGRRSPYDVATEILEQVKSGALR